MTVLDVPANRNAAEKLAGAAVRRADLTDPAAVLCQTRAGPQGQRRRHVVDGEGNPQRNDDWHAIDWMDTTTCAQEALGFQHHSWPDGAYADPWGAIRTKWDEPRPKGSTA